MRGEANAATLKVDPYTLDHLMSRAPDKESVRIIHGSFLCCSSEAYIVAPHLNCFAKARQIRFMRGHYMFFMQIF